LYTLSGKLEFHLDKAIPTDLTLHVGNDQFAVADAQKQQSGKIAVWSNSGLSWTVGEKVALRLAPGGGSGATGPDDSQVASVSVTGVSVVSDAGADKTYGNGDKIRVGVTFSQLVVDVDTSGGTPRLKIDMDPAEWGEKWAAYEEGSGTHSLTFVHTVVEPNYSTQGIAVLANTLELNGGTIRSDGEDANLAHTGLGHDPNHKVDWQTAGEGSGPVGTSTASAPTVTGVSVVSSPASGSTYMLGETIRIRATFDQAVKVTGSPLLSIDMDPAEWGTKQAAYEKGGGTSALDFAHTVVEPNYSTQGIAVLADTLALNGGTIISVDTHAEAELGHTGLGHDSAHKVDWRPSISVADASATEAAGASVAFAVTLSSAFTTAGHQMTVDYATANGSATAGADYTATSGTLTFAAGETSKTVSVPILDDSHDEGDETFTLRLSNAAGARIGDAEATGTIENTDLIPAALLARFGRATAEQVVHPHGGTPGWAAGLRRDGGSWVCSNRLHIQFGCRKPVGPRRCHSLPRTPIPSPPQIRQPRRAPPLAGRRPRRFEPAAQKPAGQGHRPRRAVISGRPPPARPPGTGGSPGFHAGLRSSRGLARPR